MRAEEDRVGAAGSARSATRGTCTAAGMTSHIDAVGGQGNLPVFRGGVGGVRMG